MPVKEAGAGDAHLVQHLRQAMRSLCMTKQCVPYLCQGNASPVYFKAVHPYVWQSNCLRLHITMTSFVLEADTPYMQEHHPPSQMLRQLQCFKLPFPPDPLILTRHGQEALLAENKAHSHGYHQL